MSDGNNDHNHAVMSDPALRKDAESFLKKILLGNTARVLPEGSGNGAPAEDGSFAGERAVSGTAAGKSDRKDPESISRVFSPDSLEDLAARIEKATGKKIRSYQEIQDDYQKHLKEDITRMENERYRKKLESLMQNCEISDYWQFENINDDGDPVYRKLIKFCHNWIHDFRKAETEGLLITDPQGVTYRFTPGTLLWLFGNFGVGKSMLAGAIAHKLMQEYLVQVEFRQWYTIYTRMQMLRDNEKEYCNYLEMLQTVDLLVIDEIAVDNTKLSEAQMRDLGMILRSRKNNGKNTIIISNATPDVMPRLVGDFCWESIKNYSLIFPYEVPGRNRRINSLGTYQPAEWGDH
ncbi:hypothetical protein [Succinimonas sp.]|uniref:hypothetical protein n=1 Tax=Succinimonas sp. TaxID=1936151 RepID=UPI0038662364